MKILYAVQATGNGHISRAVELMPTLQKLGTVDVFLSGSNAQLEAPLPVRYRSKGLSLYYGSGGLHYGKMLQHFHPYSIWREMRSLPVEKYDLVLNDFECITALACGHKGVRSIGFGHQASFQSQLTPRPTRKDLLGEQVLKRYGKSTRYIGFHFKRYDDFVYPPVIKQSIQEAEPVDHGHVTVYLPAYTDLDLYTQLRKLPEQTFHVFSKEVSSVTRTHNIHYFPVNNAAFVDSMVRSCGIITGAGFETPAEALHLGKRLMAIPIKGQYEQACNAAAMAEYSVPVLREVNDHFPDAVRKWLDSPAPERGVVEAVPLAHFHEEILRAHASFG